MADDYWFAWYPGHYERDAGHLDHVADSCYRRLIDHYMRGGEPIPKEPARLMFITRTSAPQFQAVWPQIEGFFTLVDGCLHLKRCNAELDRQDSRRRFASEAGKKSALKRSQQYQLLINDRSTTVQPPFNDPRNERIGGEGTGGNKIDISTIVPVAARETETVDKSATNGHKNGHKNGVDLNLNPLHASRAFRNGEPNKADKHALFEQRTLRFVLAHYSTDQYAEMVALQLSDDPADARKRKDVFNAADADYQSRKIAGTLQPMDGGG